MDIYTFRSYLYGLRFYYLSPECKVKQSYTVLQFWAVLFPGGILNPQKNSIFLNLIEFNSIVWFHITMLPRVQEIGSWPRMRLVCDLNQSFRGLWSWDGPSGLSPNGAKGSGLCIPIISLSSADHAKGNVTLYETVPCCQKQTSARDTTLSLHCAQYSWWPGDGHIVRKRIWVERQGVHYSWLPSGLNFSCD